MTVSTQNSQRDRGWVDGENAIKVNITGLSQLIDLNKIYAMLYDSLLDFSVCKQQTVS
ncbi:MAG: hypothetical protein WAK17_20800 [Candidatus Nitrosopolaris sp.]